MAAQKGIDMLVRVSSDGTSGGTMNVLGGLRTRSFRVNDQAIDVTSGDDTSRWRQMMTGGTRSISISGSGVFKDDAAIEDVRDHIMGTSQSLAYLQFVAPDWGTIAGAFHVVDMDISGDPDSEVTFSASFESAGDVSWTAAA